MDQNQYPLIKGQTIALSKLGDMYNAMIGHMEKLLDNLTQGIHTRLPAYKDIVDDMTESKPGYCFASNHNSNIKSCRFLDLLAKEKAGWIHSHGEGGEMVWKHVKLTGWMSKAQELNELLLVLMHMGGGQPARGQELFPILYRNMQNVHRALFVSPMGLTWILNYNKVSPLVLISGSIN
jgi:hypothetical protein